jgi:translation initiation factor 5A
MSSSSYESQSEHSEEEFAKNEEGALCFPVKVGALRKGGYVLIDDKYPCKINDLTVSKTGKHGHAKANITCVDIFTDKKYEMKESTSHSIMVPNVVKEDFSLIDIDDEGNVTYMEADGEFNTSLKLDNKGELFEAIKKDLAAGADIQVSICSAMGFSQIQSHKKE